MKKVLLIDSGLGGANILARCLKEVPCCDYLLFCDNKNLPYGNKSKQDLLKITIDNLEKIRSFFDFDIVIFACNTLTATVIEECREIYRDTVFIGTEPAILPALRKFEEKDVSDDILPNPFLEHPKYARIRLFGFLIKASLKLI